MLQGNHRNETGNFDITCECGEAIKLHAPWPTGPFNNIQNVKLPDYPDAAQKFGDAYVFDCPGCGNIGYLNIMGSSIGTWERFDRQEDQSTAQQAAAQGVQGLKEYYENKIKGIVHDTCVFTESCEECSAKIRLFEPELARADEVVVRFRPFFTDVFHGAFENSKTPQLNGIMGQIAKPEGDFVQPDREGAILKYACPDCGHEHSKLAHQIHFSYFLDDFMRMTITDGVVEKPKKKSLRDRMREKRAKKK